MTQPNVIDKMRRQLIAVDYLALAARDLEKAKRARKRYAVLAKDEYGLSNQAIAEALGVTEAAVRSIIRRARLEPVGGDE